MRKPPFNVRVFDCDTHVWEPPAVWNEFLDPAHRDSARAAFRYTIDSAGEPTVVLNGKPAPPLGSSRIVRQAIWRPDLTGEKIAALDPQRFHPLNAGAYDAPTRLADMDALGIERSLLFPTLFAEYLPAVDDPELAYVLARAYNDWVHDLCKADPERLFAAASLPFNAPDLAEAEARRAVALGFRACVVRPCLHGERFTNHPSYHRVWRVLERSGVAVFVHASPGGVNEAWTSTGGYVERIASGTAVGRRVAESVAPVLDNALALAAFCFGGHMEEYPRLKLAYTHAGGWWVPLVLERAETWAAVSVVASAARQDVDGQAMRSASTARAVKKCDVARARDGDVAQGTRPPRGPCSMAAVRAGDRTDDVIRWFRATMGRTRSEQGATDMGDLKEICGLDLGNRNNLDAEMTTLVRDIEKKYGFMPHFVRLFASDNRRLKAFMTQYMELMREDSGLTHLEHEMIALVSAATNGCVYCTAHHGALMRAETGDALFAEYLSRNYKLAELSPRHRAMLDFVVKVNRDAERIEDADRDALRAVGFDEEQIWMIILTAAFYAGANRIAQASGLRPAAQYLEMYRHSPLAARKVG